MVVPSPARAATTAQTPVTIGFVPQGDKAHPDELAFDIPLATGESIKDIRYQSSSGESSLLTSFDLQPGKDCITARFLAKLDFSQYVGQTLSLKVVKSNGFAGETEESLLLKIVAAKDLSQDVKLVAVSDGSAAPDALDFAIPGAVNLTLDDLLLVSPKQTTSVKALFALAAQRGGDTRASLQGLDLDGVAGQTLELRAAKSFKSGATPISQKLLIATQTAKDFSKDIVFAIATSGDSQPDPFTLDLAAGANVEIHDITLGGASILALFDLVRAADGSLGAKLKRAVDFDTLIGQPVVLTVQKLVGGVAYTQKLTAYAQLPTPKLLAKDDGTLSASSGLSSTVKVGNLQFVLYSDATGKSEAARNAKGAFADLNAATAYWLGTVAEASDRASLKSPLLAVKTDPANPAAFTFTPVSNGGFATQYTSPSVTVAGFTSKAPISVSGGEYALDGGAWTSAAGTVRAGQSVQVRGTSANAYSTAKTVTLTIGARSADFVITTQSAPVVSYTPPPADTTPPTTSAGPSVSGTTDTGTTLAATINETGTGYYIVQASATAAPSVAQVLAGQDGTGAAAVTSGNAAMTAATSKNFSITGLTASTAYKVYFVAKDSTNNTQAAVSSVSVTTSADATPPSTGAHSVTNIAATTADFNATINEAGTGFYIVQAAATAAPSVAQIMAGQDGLGNAAVASGSSAMTASTQKTFNITGLTVGTSYKVYFVAKDAANNPQTAAVSDTLNTIASDTTPDAFDITDMANQALSTVVTTNAIIVAGINTSVTASTTVGTIVKNGSDTGSSSTTVVVGDLVAVKLTTSGSNSTAINGTLTIGTGATSTDNFSITTVAAAPDTTPPTTSAHSVANVTATTADIRATIDEAGTGYYVVQLAATAAPSVVQIVAGQDGSGAAAPKSGNAAMTAATQKVFSVSGLAASTNYTAYFVAKDAANNTQAAAVSDALTTTADGTIPATPTLAIKSGDAYVNKTYADAHTSGGTIQVPVTISGDTDNVGVTGWFVSESSSVPVLGDFVTPKPTTVNLSTGDGTKTAYTWTRDAAGNISLAGSDTIILDTTPPAAATGLALDGGAASTTAASVALGGLTTPADADLAAWFVSESAVAPAAGDAGWSSTKPTTYSFATATTETKTVCVYVKDTADNVQGTGACDTIDKAP